MYDPIHHISIITFISVISNMQLMFCQFINTATVYSSSLAWAIFSVTVIHSDPDKPTISDPVTFQPRSGYFSQSVIMTR